MGLSYHLANLDTKEYFDPSIFGGNSKISGLLGDFLSGNALARLLVKDWMENRISAVSDNGPAEGHEMFLDYDKMKNEYTDISSKVFSIICEQQTEFVMQEIILDFKETQADTILFKNAMNYYNSSLASENFKQIFTEKFGKNFETMITKTTQSGYDGLRFS